MTRKTVSYKNRYGITISADLYQARDFDEAKKHAAIVVGPPYGGVKEQGPGIYAQNLALRGFVALAFDPSYNGYSGGEPCHSLRTWRDHGARLHHRFRGWSGSTGHGVAAGRVTMT